MTDDAKIISVKFCEAKTDQLQFPAMGFEIRTSTGEGMTGLIWAEAFKKIVAIVNRESFVMTPMKPDS